MYHKLVFWIKNKNRTVIWVVVVIILFSYKGYAQSLGDPIVNITFGSGTIQHSGPLPADSGATTYIYSNGTPNDGYYTIANSTNGMYGVWWRTTDHTGNPGGYMMIVNASVEPGIFYTRTVKGLCGNTKYQFAAWIKNLMNTNGNLPNVTFSIETTKGAPLGSSNNTGNIPTGNSWIQYPFTFITPAGTDSIVLKMTNNAPGGFGNDIAIDDITFRPYGAPVSVVFNQSATTQTLCAGTSQIFSINTTTTLASGYVQKLQQLINGVWTDQTPADTTSSYKVSSPIAAGTYSYRVVSALGNNVSSSTCVVASNPLILTVVASPAAAFSVPKNTCFGDSTVFKDQTVTNGSAIKQWLWDFGDGQTSAKQNPLHLYAKPGDYIVQLTVTNNNNCTSVATPDTIHISALPVAAFSYSTPDCETKAITLTDQSTSVEGAITSWIWDYGDGTPPETRNDNQPFQHTYASAGTYPVKLIVTNSKGCSSGKIQTVTVNPLPVVNFGTPAACISDNAMFTDSTTIADNTESSFTYLWNFGDSNATLANPNISTLKNPTHRYIQAKLYSVSLTITSKNGCSVTTTKNFTVNGAIPVAGFTVLTPNELCSDREVFFTNQSTVDFGNTTKIEWYFDYGNNPTVVQTDNSPYPGKLYRHTYPEFHTPPATKNYQVRMVAYSGTSCFSLPIDKTITLRASPQLEFPAHAPLCQDDVPLQLNARELSGIAGSGVYSGTGVSASGLFNPFVAGTGTFPIKYIFTPTNACTDTISQNITVNANPTVNAGADITILEGGTAKMHATASDSLTYAWSPATGLSNATILNPTVAPTTNTTYTLTVTNIKGCSASSKITVTVLKAPVIPNTFTPNGDGINDTWVIKYLDTYADCTIEVFNRSGKKVFSSIGYPIEWDGRYNGADLPTGGYYYLINPKHGRKVISGSITIIR